MINLNDYKMTDLSGAGVYCGTYKKYNEGSLFGMWIDLEACSDAEEFFDVCRELHKDEADPEFMFQDFQGFPKEMYHESMSADDVEKIIAYLQLDDDEREMLEAYCECTGDCIGDFEDFVDTAKECNCGQWDSFQQFADTQADVQELQKLSDMVMGHKLQFNVNNDLNRVIVKVVDTSTNEIIREIPSEDLQKLQARMKHTIGLLFDETV